ncbi:ImmA/IrrE family metallo-endopeptidase [Frankia sp. CiP3]|uniref:helix-turn-helix domain-containing protein n=1 Tax=Frankia sp. CiP3 TaxID=2880971 RepID=UPI001EF4D6DD|nr:XRE family transcriptional regulator [Frankia sp. CiP3]
MSEKQENRDWSVKTIDSIFPYSEDQALRQAEAVAVAFSPARLTLARERNGWTKKMLANKIEVSPAAVTQFESGQARPSPATLQRAANHLGVDLRYLAVGRPVVRVPEESAHFRSLRSTRAFERHQALAVVAHLAELIRIIERLVRLPQVNLPDYPLSGKVEVNVSLDGDKLFESAPVHGVTPETAARLVRGKWEIPGGPFPHLIRQLESRGIVVAMAKFGASERIDAFSCNLPEIGRPLICLSRDRQNVLRRRFNAAHELGHLVLHPEAHPGSSLQEREANRFAAELLMPANDIGDFLPMRLDLAHLMELQRVWGVSVQALLHRSHELGRLSAELYRQGMIRVNRLGWRRDEPNEEYPSEWPSLLSEAVKLASANGAFPESLAEVLYLPVAEVQDLLGYLDDARPQLRLVQPPPARLL